MLNKINAKTKCADGRARLVHKSPQNTIKKHIDKKLKEMDIAD